MSRLEQTLRVPRWLVAAASLAVVMTCAFERQASAQNCASFNPADWPAPSKPYFMMAMDTSGSMVTDVGQATTCGFGTTRVGHARCAFRNTIMAYGGEVNFGLATFDVIQQGCAAACNCSPLDTFCFSACNYFCYQSEINTRGFCAGCGPRPGNAATASGALVLVPMLQDHFWSNPPAPSNVAQLLSWADNSCTTDAEIFAIGNTPLNGMLRDMRRYYAGTYITADGLTTYPSPLAAQDLAGSGVNGSTGCRSVNVILVTDGDETCDTQADAVAAANDLYQNGVTVGGKTFKVRVHVINFAGGSTVNTNQIAAAGGTGSSYFATNEVQLSQALSDIVSGAINPESCDNTDNNCNGCVDEGYKHYCDVSQPCYDCVVHAGYATEALCRAGQLTAYQNSIAVNPPDGTVALLPCTSVAQSQVSSTWLCFDPKDRCDTVDNNCQNGVDENQTKCGNPPHCPTTEVCNGQDDDCDAQTDEGGVCGSCVSSPEACDGCDNDCDGVADDPPVGGFPQIACGLPSPPNCAGFISCKAQVNVPVGTCTAQAGYGTCSNNPLAEVCDGIDNNCNGVVDDGIASGSCVPAGHPPGLVYGGTSKCQLGTTACINGASVCQGGVGPSAELCNGIDDDCDGVVDDNTFGIGQPCGVNNPPCTPGVTACVNGALVCTGGNQPQNEICDAIDNDCDGSIDETPLGDGPLPGQNGCWLLPGNCCTFNGLSWCPPPGGNCYDAGTLSPPCHKGSLVCQGGGWACVNDKQPSAEVCDGADNNCNSQIDEGVLPGAGQVCGSDVGECQTGLTACSNGVLDCVNDIPPEPEQCDALDNDCDGTVDNGIPLGAPCDPAYDTGLYPDTNIANLPCQKGQYACSNGVLACVGGLGPSPEVCDLVDNDCDGLVDETGAAPNGIDGTASPSDPTIHIGDACGNSVGACTPGAYACVNGAVTCTGGQQPTTEQCNCSDDNCNGQTDEQVDCGGGQGACVHGADGCQCAQPCLQGEFVECPAGQKCETVTVQGTGLSGKYCVTDYSTLCGDCTQKTVHDANNVVQCAPAGTDPPGCLNTPVCECKGASGCQAPCFSVSCGPGQVCSNFGPTPGTCVVDSCYLTGCAGCDKACNQGACGDDPCEPNPCAPTEVCKPTPDFSDHVCVGSCAEVTCPADQVCVDGLCVATCVPPCAAGSTCDMGQQPPACVTDQCAGAGGSGPVVCANGACCEPVTGVCGNCPCEAVECPSGQHCVAGECATDQGTGGSGAGGSGTGGSGTGGTGATGGGTHAGASGAVDPAVWRLATGGGGCSCELGPRGGEHAGWLVVGALGLGIGMRRRRPR